MQSSLPGPPHSSQPYSPYQWSSTQASVFSQWQQDLISGDVRAAIESLVCAETIKTTLKQVAGEASWTSVPQAVSTPFWSSTTVGVLHAHCWASNVKCHPYHLHLYAQRCDAWQSLLWERGLATLCQADQSCSGTAPADGRQSSGSHGLDESRAVFDAELESAWRDEDLSAVLCTEAESIARALQAAAAEGGAIRPRKLAGMREQRARRRPP